MMVPIELKTLLRCPAGAKTAAAVLNSLSSRVRGEGSYSGAIDHKSANWRQMTVESASRDEKCSQDDVKSDRTYLDESDDKKKCKESGHAVREEPRSVDRGLRCFGGDSCVRNVEGATATVRLHCGCLGFRPDDAEQNSSARTGASGDGLDSGRGVLNGQRRRQ